MNYSVKFRGESNPKNPHLAKIRMIIYKTDYPRVERLLKITGNWKDWDQISERFKGNSKENVQLNLRLAEIHKQYIQLADEWESERMEWEPKHLSHYFDNPKNLAPSEKKILTVSQVYDLKIERLNNEEKIRAGVEKTGKNYAKLFTYHKRLLERFVKEKYGRDFSTYYFTEIDEEFLQAFVFYVEKRAIENNNNGGLRNKIHFLYLIVEEARKKNIRGADLEIFECVYEKFRQKETEPRTISYEDFLRIENFDRSLLTKKEQKWLDFYLFCFYTGGMAPIDSAYLKWSNLSS